MGAEGSVLESYGRAWAARFLRAAEPEYQIRLICLGSAVTLVRGALGEPSAACTRRRTDRVLPDLVLPLVLPGDGDPDRCRFGGANEARDVDARREAGHVEREHVGAGGERAVEREDLAAECVRD